MTRHRSDDVMARVQDVVAGSACSQLLRAELIAVLSSDAAFDAGPDLRRLRSTGTHPMHPELTMPCE